MEIKQLHTGDKDTFIGFAESRIGGRGENQDSFDTKKTKFGSLFTVCDGMGGGPGGKTASSIAVREIIAGVDEANSEETITNIIIKAIRRANMAILEAGNEDPSLHGMGSTATVLLLSDYAAYVAHVGDSRVYQFRGHKKIFRTFDHSMVFDLVKQGVITEEQARLSAQSNVITRALGIQPDVEVDIQELPYEKGDRFLLCSDGIHGTMPEAELIQHVTSRKNVLGALTDDIATMVDNFGRTNGGGHDNLTLAIIETKNNSKLRPIMTKTTKLLLLALSIICFISIVLNIVQCSGGKQPVDSGTLTDSIATLHKEKLDTIKSLSDTIKARDSYISTAKERASKILTSEKVKEVFNK
ncbi:MAG: serine/threonine-protein phosphatase [Prevotella sp.]|nr:serine/threonine-protein phosphatase [Prevotella sp.]